MDSSWYYSSHPGLAERQPKRKRSLSPISIYQHKERRLDTPEESESSDIDCQPGSQLERDLDLDHYQYPSPNTKNANGAFYWDDEGECKPPVVKTPPFDALDALGDYTSSQPSSSAEGDDDDDDDTVDASTLTPDFTDDGDSTLVGSPHPDDGPLMTVREAFKYYSMYDERRPCQTVYVDLCPGCDPCNIRSWEKSGCCGRKPDPRLYGFPPVPRLPYAPPEEPEPKVQREKCSFEEDGYEYPCGECKHCDVVEAAVRAAKIIQDAKDEFEEVGV
jgi:hypothetical protein